MQRLLKIHSEVKFHMSWLQKISMIMLASVFLLSVMITGTYAWNTAANILNEFFGDSRSCAVILEKYEKDIHGAITEKPIEGAVFSLYQIQERQVSANETEFEEVLLEKGLKTDSDGRIQIESLAAGEYYFQEDSPTYLYTYDKEEEGEVIRKYYFEVTKEILDSGKQVKVTAYNQRLTGQLLVRKTVKNTNDMELTSEQKEQDFTFQIIFSEDGAYTYSINGGEEQQLSDGTITLKHGEEALFTNLSAGMEYSVQEIPVDGYNIISNNHQGNILPEKSRSLLDEGADNTELPYGITVADYVNVWEDQTPSDSTLIISKEVVGDNEETIETTEFQFLVTIGDNEEQTYTYRIEEMEAEDFKEPQDSLEPENSKYSIRSGDIITLHHGERAVFEDIPTGTFYEVEELEIEGYTPLHESYTGKTLADEVTELFFVNYRDAIKRPETGQLTITKEITGTGASDKDVFDFCITFLDEEGNVLEQEYPYLKDGEPLLLQDGWFDGTLRFHLRGGESIVFKGLPDGIRYIVSEEENQEGYEARLKEKGGTIIGGTEGTVWFRNHREEEGEEPIEILVRKITTGENSDLKKAFTFTFESEDYIETFALASGQEKLFKLLPGTHYKVEEQDASANGYLQTSVTNGYGTANGERIVIEKTNTKIPDIIDPKPEPGKKISLHVEKVWQKDNETVRPGSIRVQLYRNGEAYGSEISMSSESGWNHTWSGLPDTYSWTADELVIPDGYKKEVSGTVTGGFTITNTYTKSLPEEGSSEGEKQGGRKPGDSSRDKSGDGTGEDSDQRNGNGKAASTGDDMNIWFWTILLVGSAMAMKSIRFDNKREKG